MDENDLLKRKSTILIVDDDPLARESLESLLLTEGYNLEFAQNGFLAITKAKEIIPDIILLDVMMPEMDGFMVCKHIRNDEILKEIPIILITALDDRDSRIEGIKAGADDFISKPYDRTELRLRIKTLTRLDRYRLLISNKNLLQSIENKQVSELQEVDKMNNLKEIKSNLSKIKELLDNVEYDGTKYAILILEARNMAIESIIGLEKLIKE